MEGCLDRPPDPLPTRVDSLPTLPESYDAALEAGLAAIGVALSTDARATIDGHVRLLLAWNAAINLTAIRDPAEIAIRHVVDSLTALRILEARGVAWILDLGSGGGFPGLPLLATLPWGRGVLVESVAKKGRFLETVVEATGMGDVVTVRAVRAEALVATGGAPRGAAVVARAVAPLGELIELALPLLGPGGSLIAWKDVRAVSEGSELEGARRAIAAIDPGARINAVAAVPDEAGPAVDALRDHRLVIVTASGAEIARTWPRDPAARKRRPW
ncbi:MAG TPA: 16S rRNA (guanine(527)-N(7))-methyltransferase RsmG [Candidatus Limnocylindrales bacterium]|nr:16S rRNA (guanine(527)-N(7))-methyltransferase RsmG [Candidatus Limnocylindrales bacterium]